MPLVASPSNIGESITATIKSTCGLLCAAPPEPTLKPRDPGHQSNAKRIRLMKKARLFGLLGILCLLAGCKQKSPSQPAATGSKPSVVQDAAPAASTASATTPQPDAGTGLLTPHPSASQRVDDRSYLVSSDQNFTVGAQIVTGTGEMLFTRLAVTNQTASPVVFDVKDVTVDAPGRKIAIVPRTTLATMVGGNPGTQDVVNRLRSDYWDDSTALAPNSQEEHFLLALCGKGCPMPVTFHVAVGGQSYDFAFGDASNAQASTTEITPSAHPQVRPHRM